MSGTANQLAQLPFLAEVPLADLQSSARLWRQQELSPGEVLCEEGEPANALSLVLSGELRAEVSFEEVGRATEGEMVGEVATFLAGATCSATLVAELPCTLLSLRRASLLALRRRGSPLYGALLDAALQTLCERVRATDAMIAELCRADPDADSQPPTAPKDGAPRPALPPPLAPMLRALPAMSGLSMEPLLELAAAFEPVAVVAGEELVAEGVPGDAAFIVASGEVEVRRELGDGRPGRLTRLRAGDPFGFNALLDDGARSASCVALVDGWVYKLTAERNAAISGPVTLSWREGLLATLATQLRVANAIVSGARSLGVANALVLTQDFRALMAASGALTGLPLSETEEEAMVPAAHVDPLSLPPKAER